MQKRNGKWGPGYNASDFFEDLWDIAEKAREWYNEQPRDFPFSRIVFMADNTHVHNLTDEEIARITGPTGPLVSAAQIRRAPRYSGDIMQCIEHVHAILASEWWRERFEEGQPSSDDCLAQLHAKFFGTEPDSGITPDMVAAMVARLKVLLKHIVEVGTGGYASPKFT
jgi:hypothetical protein